MLHAYSEVSVLEAFIIGEYVKLVFGPFIDAEKEYDSIARQYLIIVLMLNHGILYICIEGRG